MARAATMWMCLIELVILVKKVMFISGIRDDLFMRVKKFVAPFPL
jgi:hypothetical protein